MSLLSLFLGALVPPLPPQSPIVKHAVNPETVSVELRYVCDVRERVIRYQRKKHGGVFAMTSVSWAGKTLPSTQIEAANRAMGQIAVGDIHPQCSDGHDELLASGSKDGKSALVILFVTPERITSSDLIALE